MDIMIRILTVVAVVAGTTVHASPFILSKVINNSSKSILISINGAEVKSLGPNSSTDLNLQIPLASESQAEQINFNPKSGSSNRYSNTLFNIGPKESHQVFNLLVSRTLNTASPNKQFPGTTHRSQVEVFLFENTLNKPHNDATWEQTKRVSGTNYLYFITIRFNQTKDDGAIVPKLEVVEQHQ